MITGTPNATVVDLAGEELGTMRGHLPRDRSPEGTQHLYILQFGDLVKVGRTNNPTGRFVFHRNSNLRSFGGPLVRAWVSAAHATARTNEDALRGFCKEIGGRRWTYKHEVFTGLTDRVESVIERAAALAAADPTLVLHSRPTASLAAVTAERDALRGALGELVALQDSPLGWGPETDAWDRARRVLAAVAGEVPA